MFFRKGKRENRLWCQASYTVEAAFLVPVTLFLLVLIGTTALYLHDRSIACFNAEAITIRGRMLTLGNAGEAESELTAFISESGTQGVLMTQSAGAQGEIGTLKISASVEGEIQNAFLSVFSAWGWPVLSSFNETDEDWNVDPCTLIRSARILNGED